MRGAKAGTFYHSTDTWSNTVAEAEAHARHHAVDDGPGYSAADFDEPEHLCEACDGVLALRQVLREEDGTVYFECCECSAEYDPDEIPEYLHPERDDG